MKEKPRARSRKKKPFPLTKAIIATGVALTAVTGMGVGYYIHKGKEYETTFFPSTKINGVDASDKTVDQVEEMIAAQVADYELKLVQRNGDIEKIKGEEIGISTVFDGELEQCLSEQEPMEWMLHLTEKKEHQIDAVVIYDEKKLEEKLESLEMFKEENTKQPRDAYLSEYIPGQGYKIVPEDQGNALDKEKVAEFVKYAIQSLTPKLMLEDLDVYEKPSVTSDNEKLQEQAQRLNRYQDMSVIYEFGDKQEVLNGTVISQWMSLGEDGNIKVDRAAVESYVKELASIYNTAYHKKTLNTSYGPTVEITEGDYGWRINQNAETEALCQILMSGESQVREPIYSQKAASHGVNDYGDTYVEINLTAQHLYFYKNGELLIESDFVSGNSSKGYDTPAGAYPITYKQRNATLKGEGYSTPVSYWMPFNRNIGMHDASWRTSFGGDIYKTNGSHGCINLPPSVAQTIFENIEAGMPVLCYHLKEADASKANSGSESTTGNTATEAAPPAETAANQDQRTVNPGNETSAGTVPENGSAGNGTGETDRNNTVPGTDDNTDKTEENGAVSPTGDGSNPGDMGSSPVPGSENSPADMSSSPVPGSGSGPADMSPSPVPGNGSGPADTSSSPVPGSGNSPGDMSPSPVPGNGSGPGDIQAGTTSGNGSSPGGTAPGTSPGGTASPQEVGPGISGPGRNGPGETGPGASGPGM